MGSGCGCRCTLLREGDLIMRTHALALVGMMAVSLGLAGCKTCCCCDSWGGLCGDSTPTQDAKPLPETKGQPLTRTFSPTQNMQINSTPPAQWNNAPAAKLAMPQTGDAQVRVTTTTTTPASQSPAMPADGAVRSNWNAATPAAITPVSAAAPALTPSMDDMDMPSRRSVSIPSVPTAPERETFEATAPQPVNVATPEPTAPALPTAEPVAPFGTPRDEN